MLGNIFNAGTLLSTLNTATIVVLAGLGCLLTDQSGMMNIGLDGMMVIGAFGAAVSSWYFGSWVWGVVFAVLLGIAVGLFYGLFVVSLGSDEFIIGVGLNTFAVALTTFLLRTALGQSGSFHPTTGAIDKIPAIDFGSLGGSRMTVSLMVPVSLLLVLLCWLMLRRTPFGYWLHAAGEAPKALQAVGRSPARMKYFASVACGVLCSLSGAYLSLGYLSTFTENMSDSRGYVAVACVIFGRSDPLLMLFAALLFGFIDAAALRMQDVVSPTLTATFPYIGTILMMVFLALRAGKRRRAAAKA